MSEKNQIDEQKELEARQAVTEQWLRDVGLVYVLRNGANYYEVVVTMVAGSRRPEERAKFAERIRNMLAKAQQPVAEGFAGRVFVDQLTGKREVQLSEHGKQLPDMARLYSAPAAQQPSETAIHNAAVEAAAKVCKGMIGGDKYAHEILATLLRDAAQEAEFALNAERWEFARQYLSVDEIESFAAMKKAGHKPDTVESKKADAAIDAAMQAQRKEGA